MLIANEINVISIAIIPINLRLESSALRYLYAQYTPKGGRRRLLAKRIIISTSASDGGAEWRLFPQLKQ